MILNQQKITEAFMTLLSKDDLSEIKNKINEIKNNVRSFKSDNIGLLNIDSNGETISISFEYLINELDQILDTKTIERTKYYIERLVKALTKIKTGKVNDLNLYRWKEYDDLITDSLWILKKRDNSGAHSAEYWGNFIPQIPNQFLRRYTKESEWILDPFLGCGTTLIECKRLGRNGIGIELQKNVVDLAKRNLENEGNLFSKEVETIIINNDSSKIDYKNELEKIGVKSIQLIIMHPPYWDIIKFSKDKKDLSNAKTMEEFLNLFGVIIDKTYPILDKGRYLVLVIGDKYSHGEWIPLGFYTMQEILKRGYKLKSTIVKNFEETLGKRNQKELWRYRALVGGFYIFKHEYIFLFKKK